MTRAYQCRTCLSKAFPAAVTLAEDNDSHPTSTWLSQDDVRFSDKELVVGLLPEMAGHRGASSANSNDSSEIQGSKVVLLQKHATTTQGSSKSS
jgi:hypothetical protein